jgi:hypothetical protein
MYSAPLPTSIRPNDEINSSVQVNFQRGMVHKVLSVRTRKQYDRMWVTEHSEDEWMNGARSDLVDVQGQMLDVPALKFFRLPA